MQNGSGARNINSIDRTESETEILQLKNSATGMVCLMYNMWSVRQITREAAMQFELAV